MKEEENISRLLKGLHSNRWWIYLVAITGLSFIALMAWKFVINDHYFFRREGIVQIILISLVVVGIFRYFLFIRQQAGLSGSKRNDREKIETHYRRSFYFWLTEAILTIGAMGLFLYMVYEGF